METNSYSSPTPEEIEITAPEGVEYLSDLPSANNLFPNHPCLLHKGKTGCGGTSVVLYNSIDYIVAVPTVNLVKNKAGEHTLPLLGSYHALGIYAEVSDSEILDYMMLKIPHKLIVTYNSLPRMVKLLQEKDCYPYQKMRLLVDEYHVLFNSYDFRKEAIINLLCEAKKN
ncbi:MAG: hypothetical protein ACK5JS_08965 [Mangrovibacterium sp.]